MTKSPTLREAADAYLAFHQHWKAQRHMKARLKNFWSFFPAEISSAALTRDDINRWTRHLLEARGFNPNYARLLLSTIRGFYHWLEGEDLVEVNPLNGRNIFRPPKVKFDREPFTYEQYQAALKEAEKSMIRQLGGGAECANYVPGAIRIGFFTGLRLGDVANLAWVPADNGNWVDLSADKVVAHPIKMRRFLQRIEIPLDPELREWLIQAEQQKEHEHWILPVMHLTMTYDAQQVSRALRVIFRRAGLETQTFHSFRHGFVTRLVNAGIDPLIVGQMTGQSLATIARYSHVSMDAKRRALESMRSAERKMQAAPVQL